MHRVAAIGRRAAHDVAGHVAAGPHRRQPDLVDAAQRPHEVPFRHAVELQVLPAGDAQRAAAHLVAKVQLGQQLIAAEPSAGNGRPHHETIGPGVRRLVRAAQVLAPVAVDLLIDAVELEQLGALVAEVIGGVGQFRGDPPAQIIALRLRAFQRAELR